MKIAALCSGGKDSTFALWLAIRDKHDVEKMIFIVPQREDSWMFHYPNVHLYGFYSICCGIPAEGLIFNGNREDELPFLEEIVKQLKVEGIVSGVISSEFQKKSLDKICKKLGMLHIAPLWGRKPEEILEEEVKSGIEFIIDGVFAEGLGREWLGRRIKTTEVEELLTISERYGVNPCGEGGEYETLVLDAPFFKSKMSILEAEVLWDGQRGIYLVKKVRLEDKK